MDSDIGVPAFRKIGGHFLRLIGFGVQFEEEFSAGIEKHEGVVGNETKDIHAIGAAIEGDARFVGEDLWFEPVDGLGRDIRGIGDDRIDGCRFEDIGGIDVCQRDEVNPAVKTEQLCVFPCQIEGVL